MFLFRPLGRMILFLAADGVAEFIVPPVHQVPDENRPFEPWDFQTNGCAFPSICVAQTRPPRNLAGHIRSGKPPNVRNERSRAPLGGAGKGR